MVRTAFFVCYGLLHLVLADALGQGSTQATGEASSSGKDQPFWDSLNANVKNLHAVISGHGECDARVGSTNLT